MSEGVQNFAEADLWLIDIYSLFLIVNRFNPAFQLLSRSTAASSIYKLEPKRQSPAKFSASARCADFPAAPSNAINGKPTSSRTISGFAEPRVLAIGAIYGETSGTR